MSSLFEKLLDRAGISKVPRYAKESFGFRARIQATSEFKRVESIPRLIYWSSLHHDIIKCNTLKYTEDNRQIAGQMQLWSIQAAALFHIYSYQSAFLPIGVGQGKALISLLAANEIPCERPVLFVPAQLREQTKAFVIPEMLKHWKLHSNLKVIGYSELSLAKNADMLEELQPDLIILDECHALKNKAAGRTKRMMRYFKKHPETRCVAMSGTIATRSLRDWAHIAAWCLRERTPVPLNWPELCEWSDCLDSDVDDDNRVHPGALMAFCKEGENVNQGFRRRLVETPGVVASKEDDLGVSLRIIKKDLEIPEKIKVMINKMRRTWETPNGDIITEAVELWRHIRELALGFWYTWEEKPPEGWLEARREWKSYVRETLKHNRRGLDTELQVWNECQKSFFTGPGYVYKKEDIEPQRVWNNWKQIKDTYKPKTVAVWESDFALRTCYEWFLENENGIIWTEHREFGKQLEICLFNNLLVRYYGAGDDHILKTKDTRIIASIGAHSQGKNLQRFSKNLVVSPMTSGKAWEQLLARTHRHGQQADEVTCEVFLHLPELMEGFEQARKDARYLEDTYGNRQKLNYADMVM